MDLLPRKMLGSGSGVGLTGLGVVASTFGSAEGIMGLGKLGVGIGRGATAEGVGRGAGVGTGRGLIIPAGLDGGFTSALFLGDFGS
jgi:hypothetical protein